MPVTSHEGLTIDASPSASSKVGKICGDLQIINPVCDRIDFVELQEQIEVDVICRRLPADSQ
jgi:hypothetical protein